MFLFSSCVEDRLALWNHISDYNVAASRFYNDGNQQLMTDCFESVIRGVSEICESLKIGAEHLFIYRFSRVGSWHPFQQALFYHWLRQPDRKVKMPLQESYSCKDNRWSAYLPIYYSDQKHIVGRIIKKMEACLREDMKYKYKLKADSCIFYRSSGTPIELDAVIEKAVSDFRRDLTRTVVTVDHANLARIRKEALGTQDKLIVTEEEVSQAALPVRAGHDDRIDPPIQTELSIPVVADAHIDPPTSAAPPVPAELDDRIDPPDARDGWLALQNALNAIELQALSIALRGGVNIKTFADENGIMLEVLADSINEKAADIIGDSILETDDGIIIYDEYSESIAQIVNANRY